MGYGLWMLVMGYRLPLLWEEPPPLRPPPKEPPPLRPPPKEPPLLWEPLLKLERLLEEELERLLLGEVERLDDGLL